MRNKKWFLILCIGIGFAAFLTLFVAAVLTSNRPGVSGGPTTTATTLPPPEENVFTPMDFAYDGDYLTCTTQKSVLGIDVSKYQGDIDWEKVKQAGVEFVIIRVGGRGYGSSGVLYSDPKAQKNYAGAKAAGLKVGGYFFSQAITVAEAVEEANYTLELTKDWELDMPLVYDWECLADDYRTVGVSRRMLTDCTKAFCDTVEAAGHSPMVYFNPSQSQKEMHLEELVDYGFWLAMYSDKMNYPYKVDMWQYTNKGSVPGIAGNVDINLFFPYEEA